MIQMFKSAVKDIKIVVLIMLKEIEKKVSQVDKKINSPGKKKYYLKKNQMEILEFTILYLKLRIC